MSHARTSSEATVKTPHSVGLKVLRLSRPSLSQQTPLPPTSPSANFKIDPAAAFASHSAQPDSQFILSPLLTLPSSFGTLHVGETFTCTLCVNNALASDTDNNNSITGVRITAEMQTPTAAEPIQLELDAAPGVSDPTAAVSLAPNESLQRIMRYYLREEGGHVLAVNVTYTESVPQPADADTDAEELSATSSRVRSFRKLYQFAAQSLMGIRTKIRTMPSPSPSKSTSAGKVFALEAQLENYSENAVILDEVEVLPRKDMESKSLNAWEMPDQEKGIFECKPSILPGDVMQLAYVLSDVADAEDDSVAKMRKEATGLCQLAVRWRGSLGEEGALTTAWLGGKRRA